MLLHRETSLLDKDETKDRDRIPITIAMADYDRTRRLIDGRVKPRGLELRASDLYIGDFCTKPVYEQYDAAEMSLSWYVMARCRGEPVIALPIFPLRMSVFAYVLVRDDSPFTSPKDLVGKRVGVTAYRMTVSMWLRGIFEEYYDLSPQQVSWVKTWETEGAGYVIPPDIRSEFAPNRTPEQLLEKGEVDAIFVPELPPSYVAGLSRFRRLFRDARSEMHSFVNRSGVLPITHAVVMRQALADESPWIAESIMDAFIESQRLCDEYWHADEKHLGMSDAIFFLEEQRKTYGVHSWTHGLQGNQDTLRAFLRYAHRQGYLSREMSPEELFVPATLKA